jgi:hypothetical protein
VEDDDGVDRTVAERRPPSGALAFPLEWSGVRATDWQGGDHERTRRNAIAKDAPQALIRRMHLVQVVRTHSPGFRWRDESHRGVPAQP